MTALPSTEDLARLAKAITPGPWKAGRHPWPTQVGCCPIPGRPYEIRHEMRNLAAANTIANAEAIALLPALLREVLDRREAEGWRDISTAPKDGLIDIWVSNSDGTGRRICSCYYDHICDEWRTSSPALRLHCVKASCVTHWRPLPAPPSTPTTEASHDR